MDYLVLILLINCIRAAHIPHLDQNLRKNLHGRKVINDTERPGVNLIFPTNAVTTVTVTGSTSGIQSTTASSTTSTAAGSSLSLALSLASMLVPLADATTSALSAPVNGQSQSNSAIPPASSNTTITTVTISAIVNAESSAAIPPIVVPSASNTTIPVLTPSFIASPDSVAAPPVPMNSNAATNLAVTVASTVTMSRIITNSATSAPSITTTEVMASPLMLVDSSDNSTGNSPSSTSFEDITITISQATPAGLIEPPLTSSASGPVGGIASSVPVISGTSTASDVLTSALPSAPLQPSWVAISTLPSLLTATSPSFTPAFESSPAPSSALSLSTLTSNSPPAWSTAAQPNSTFFAQFFTAAVSVAYVSSTVTSSLSMQATIVPLSSISSTMTAMFTTYGTSIDPQPSVVSTNVVHINSTAPASSISRDVYWDTADPVEESPFAKPTSLSNTSAIFANVTVTNHTLALNSMKIGHTPSLNLYLTTYPQPYCYGQAHRNELSYGGFHSNTKTWIHSWQLSRPLLTHEILELRGPHGEFDECSAEEDEEDGRMTPECGRLIGLMGWEETKNMAVEDEDEDGDGEDCLMLPFYEPVSCIGVVYASA